ncbi:MAG: ChbG/HpnK family deacetylase, partial [Thermoanaerobaculia bacterium]
FPKKYTSFVPLYVARAISLNSVERELRSQIERVLATGLRVTHLNGHQHLHLLPRIFAVVRRLASEYKIGYVRIVDDRGGAARALSMRVLSTLGRKARTDGLTNDRTIGVAMAGHLQDVVPLLDHVEGITELVTHPGIGVSGYAWGYDWDRETRALCDRRLRDELANRVIRLAAPSAVRPV